MAIFDEAGWYTSELYGVVLQSYSETMIGLGVMGAPALGSGLYAVGSQSCRMKISYSE